MEQIKKENRGGARANCGRKPLLDKKIPITMYIPKSVIEKYGGTDRVKDKLIKLLN